MSISNVGQTSPISSVQSGKNPPHQAVSKATDSAAEVSPASRTVDMRNVSLNEINALIKSGVEGLLDVLPFFIPPRYH